MDYEALRNEILNDPRGLGYAGKTDVEIAELVNGIGGGGDAVERGRVAACEIVAATAASEWESLSASAKQHYQTIISAGQVDLGSSHVREALAAMFGVGTVTQTNLGKLGSRAASRAEVLGLEQVHYWDVGRAKE